MQVGIFCHINFILERNIVSKFRRLSMALYNGILC